MVRLIIRRVVLFVIFLALIPFLLSVAREGLRELSGDWDFSKLIFMWMGVIFYFFIYLVVNRREGNLWNNHEFLRILRHELTHAVSAILLGNPVIDMYVSNVIDSDRTSAGAVRSQSLPIIGSFVSLAPYILPLFFIPFLLLKLLPPNPYHWFIDALIGFTLAFHFVSVFRELLVRQADLRGCGYLFSYTLIIIFNIAILLILKTLLSGTPVDFKNLYANLKETSKVNYTLANDQARSLLGWLINKVAQIRN